MGADERHGALYQRHRRLGLYLGENPHLRGDAGQRSLDQPRPRHARVGQQHHALGAQLAQLGL